MVQPVEKIWGIEAARGIAASMVVFYHAARHIQQDLGTTVLWGITQFGHAGVDFFFVLSGFIIYWVHSRDIGQRFALPAYAWRRFIRIFPLYWAVLLVTLPMIAVSASRSWPSNVLLLQSLFLLPHEGDAVVGVAWTLQFEVVFYLVFAVAILSRRAGICIFSIWISIVLQGFFWGERMIDSVVFDRLSSPFNIEFFLGAMAAHLTSKKLIPKTTYYLPVGTVLLTFFGLLENFGFLDGYAALARLAYGLSAMLCVIGLAGGAIAQLTQSSIVVVIGRASYSIYLVHLIFIGVIYKIGSKVGVLTFVPPIVVYSVLVVGGIGGGMLVSRWVEYPLMNWTKKKLSWA